MDRDSQKIEQAAQVLDAMVEKAHKADPSATDQLRAFEDKVLGKDIPRIEGKLERGYGSRYSEMKPDCKAAHAALEKLVETETRMTAATNELAQAKAAFADATAAVKRHANAIQ